ncbi:MAG: Ribonucleoside-triphosphate reductase [Parcubacteria group bacterium GW2011_GWF2_52_12]|nr:MAG: Ribonucleoside-triphosphate reductase [Parcubacteria group bacterium GW2011_GWC1_51_35]KKW24837.1 MAG: Ribonucleoside-triphosphate reductase [Parcubacteria group bacterium GW2011_GWF2_52_12]KKW27847.1 MAG: Ribonucleoside-triphosphate reductase [Parcubacteria group bacterium GW2011_GWF1_52_5]KKW34793.1 MAG: Ribonucleoside-triphosphate reductase [Parcubacteria group bacterium GW2011_GWB1_53_43]KKW38638.1 MAG: Ribonucleoside-triphosphate reductase [Parcubacteria group bacterium GW2011_GWA1
MMKISKKSAKMIVKSAKTVKKEQKSIFPSQVRKRNGAIVDFDISRIEAAIGKAMRAAGEYAEGAPEGVAAAVAAALVSGHAGEKSHIPSVEETQDLVERELMLQDHVATAKAYILYRERRAEVRREKGEIPEKVRDLVAGSKKYFKNPLGEFIYYRTYSRWIDDEGRRETWVETVDRYINFMRENLGKRLSDKEYSEVRQAILSHEAMPSMRLLQFAGKAARTTNVCAYNCSFIAPTKLDDFAEIMYISMCGTGAGFSVESQYIQQLPVIKRQSGKLRHVHVIDDSKEGWCDALTLGLKTWYAGEDVQFDYSRLRPAGARLKTMGGKSSGPDPLRELLTFARATILKRQGRRLTNLDAHDIICKIGEIVVAGGVRRSALISLSDLDDVEMRDAKKGQFYITEPQRSLANNSAVYNEKPGAEEFMREWLALMESHSGERGIFNRGGLRETFPERRTKMLEERIDTIGTNPCGEILLQPKQFCNLSEIVARAEDTPGSLMRKMKIATLLGTYQSTLTNFPYLSREWKEHCEEERLLGVSITGQWDSPAVRKPEMLKKLRDAAVVYNREYAKRFTVSPSTCITCTKPSGTLSQMVDCASGMHPRHAPYYIRRVRIASTDALFQMLRDQGVPYHPEVGQNMETATTFVIDFPVKAPDAAIFRDQVPALELLEYWKDVKENYTEHNPSVTISVGDDEWLKTGNWVYENWKIVGGLSFLPRSNHVYKLAPYEEIDEKAYHELLERFAHVDFSKIVTYEREDGTENKRELACASGTCEVEPVGDIAEE